MVLYTFLARSKNCGRSLIHTSMPFRIYECHFYVSSTVQKSWALPFCFQFQPRSMFVHNRLCFGQFWLVTKFVNDPNLLTGFPKICESPFTQFKWAPALANGRLYNCNPFQKLWVSGFLFQPVGSFVNRPLYTIFASIQHVWKGIHKPL